MRILIQGNDISSSTVFLNPELLEGFFSPNVGVPPTYLVLLVRTHGKEVCVGTAFPFKAASQLVRNYKRMHWVCELLVYPTTTTVASQDQEIFDMRNNFQIFLISALSCSSRCDYAGCFREEERFDYSCERNTQAYLDVGATRQKCRKGDWPLYSQIWCLSTKVLFYKEGHGRWMVTVLREFKTGKEKYHVICRIPPDGSCAGGCQWLWACMLSLWLWGPHGSRTHFRGSQGQIFAGSERTL